MLLALAGGAGDAANAGRVHTTFGYASDHRALGDRKLAGRQRKADADHGRHVRVPEAILGFMRAEMANADRPETQDAYLSLSRLLLEVLASGRRPREIAAGALPLGTAAPGSSR